MTEPAEQSQQNVTNIVATLTSLVLALIVGAIALYAAWKAGKEKARLLHEQDVEAERLVQAQVDASDLEGAAQVMDAMARAEASEARIEAIKAEIETQNRDHAVAMEKISSLTSWDSFRVVRKP